MRIATLLTAFLLALTIGTRVAGQSTTSRASTPLRLPNLPPVLQTCPMHPDVVEDKPGTCPLCSMQLVPVRLESVWSCPVHAAVTRQTKNLCPICNRELVQMTVALTWTCRNRSDINAIDPGRCPDGSPMVAKRTLRPHGNHNPQHGGQFFMAPDNTHHLEGTLPSSRVFRVYLYDDYARPLAAARLKDVRGVVEVGGRTVTLAASTSGSYLQGRIDPAAFPARLTAKIRLTPAASEYRFDFAFPAVTKDPNEGPRRGRARPTSPPTRAAAITAGDREVDIAPDPALIQVPIPDTVPAILAQLRTRDSQVRELLDRGSLPAVFVPAFQARDLALALETRMASVSAGQREMAGAAIQDLVRAAWLIDAFGDVGNADQARAAFAAFHDAARRIGAAFGATR